MISEELKQMAYEAKHFISIRKDKYILRNMIINNTLTFHTEEEAIEFCRKNIDSWKFNKRD